MELNLNIDLNLRQIREIKSLIFRHLPDTEVWIHGSRVKWTSSPESDLDLVVFSTSEQSLSVSDLREAFEESNLPFRIDLLVWNNISERFRKQIMSNHVVLIHGKSFTFELINDNSTMPDGWKEQSVSDLAIIKGGKQLNKQDFVENSSIPVFGGAGIMGYTNKHNKEGLIITFGRVGAYCGQFFLYRGKAWINNNASFVTPKLNISGEWLFYALKSLDLKNIIKGAAQPFISNTDISKLLVKVPPFHEQKSIANILETLDNKIELNRCMNKTLERIAMAIFKDWFINFGPTCAKVEGLSSYLASNIWNQFPDTLDIDDKPTAWQVYALSDLALQHRATLSPNTQPNRVYEYYSIPAYDAGYEPGADLGSSIKSNKIIVPPGVVLLSKINPEIERIWLPQTSRGVPQIASTELLALRPLAPATRTVLYFLFKNQDFKAKMTAFATGTSKSHQRVHVKSLFSCKVLTASSTLLALFDEMMDPIINRLLSNRRESRWLIQTRDILLPKLISGGLQIKEAHKILKKKHNLRVDRCSQNVAPST